MEEYDDIINLPHHVSKVHPQMSMMNRAAQFAPFAALTGHNAAIDEAARIFEEEKLSAGTRISYEKLENIQKKYKRYLF